MRPLTGDASDHLESTAHEDAPIPTRARLLVPTDMRFLPDRAVLVTAPAPPPTPATVAISTEALATTTLCVDPLGFRSSSTCGVGSSMRCRGSTTGCSRQGSNNRNNRRRLR
jgi:hypothetical protein